MAYTKYPTGADVTVDYGWEAVAYGTETALYDKNFGWGTKVTAQSKRNNIESLYGLGSRNASKLVEKKYEGSLSVEAALCDAYWLKGAVGDVTDAGAGPYTHTYAETNVLTSFSVRNAINMDTDAVIAALGCKIASATLTGAVGEITKIKLDIPYSTEVKTTSVPVSPAACTEEPFTFAQGVFEIPNSTTIGEVQNVEYTLNNSPELLWGLGSRFASKWVEKQREHKFKVTAAFKDAATFLEREYGAVGAPASSISETATCRLTFTNSGLTTALRSLVLTFAGIKIDEWSMPEDPAEVLKEDVTFSARTLSSAVYTNNVAASL